jgi:hypothetical protein
MAVFARDQLPSRSALSRFLAALTEAPVDTLRTLLRLDGQYGTGAVLADLAGFADVPRGKEYTALDHPLVQARLHLPPDQFQQRTAKPDGSQSLRLSTGPGRTRRDGVPWSRRDASGGQKEEPRRRHPFSYRLRTLLHESAASLAFTVCDVIELYLHRGAFEPT